MILKCRPYTRNLLWLLIILVFLVAIFTSSYFITDENRLYQPIPMKYDNLSQCYKSPNLVDNPLNHSANSISIQYFEEISNTSVSPTPGKTIFFHETSCSKTGIVELNAKQACAIESAARLHPNHDIFVLFVSPVGLKSDGSLPKYYDQLQKFQNIHWRTVNLWKYSFGTKLHNWLMTNKLFDSSYVFEHMSDIVRALSLFHYGGYHIDLDVIVLKNLDNLGENFVGDDNDDVINAAVMHLNRHGIGLHALQRFFLEVIKSFNGDSFIANGPRMLTRVFEDICKTKNRKQWTRQQCNGLTLQPKEYFYPISWSDFMLYFDASKADQALNATKNAHVIHVWNDRSKSIWNRVGIKNAYQILAKQKCPAIYNSSEYF